MKMKQVLSRAWDSILSSYEGKKFWPSLILRLVYALISAVFTAVFANTLFSRNNTLNQIFSALFFYFLLLAVSKLIEEGRRGGLGGRLKNAFCSMVQLKPPALWFFLAAAALSLVLPYAFVLALALLLFSSVVSGKNSLLLGVKNAVTKGKNPERNGKGLAAFTSGLIACALIVCILANLGVPTLYGLIDGRASRGDVGQTDRIEPNSPAAPDSSSDPASEPDSPAPAPSGEVIVDRDVSPVDAASQLTARLIELAGKDRAAFEKLFRNTESSAVDQYYNQSYDSFRACEKSLIAIAAQDDSYVWFTALYYRIPAGYPAEKEQSVYLSTIMSRAADGWKLEWNDGARARLEESFHNAGFSAEGYAAMEQGYAWAKFFIPFDLYTTMLYYDNAVMCKLVEMYFEDGGDLNLTFYASNGMAKDAALTGIDLTVTDENQPLFAKSFSLDRLVQADNVSLFALKIPAQELDFSTWTGPKIADFTFRYDLLEN